MSWLQDMGSGIYADNIFILTSKKNWQFKATTIFPVFPRIYHLSSIIYILTPLWQIQHMAIKWLVFLLLFFYVDIFTPQKCRYNVRKLASAVISYSLGTHSLFACQLAPFPMSEKKVIQKCSYSAGKRAHPFDFNKWGTWEANYFPCSYAMQLGVEFYWLRRRKKGHTLMLATFQESLIRLLFLFLIWHCCSVSLCDCSCLWSWKPLWEGVSGAFGWATW